MGIAISHRAAALLALAAVLGTAGWGSALAAGEQRSAGDPERQAITAQAPRARCQADGPLRDALGAKAAGTVQPGAAGVIAAAGHPHGAGGLGSAPLHG